MERADRQLRQELFSDKTFQPLTHLAGGFVRKSDGQDGARRYAQIADQVGDPVREHAGLARSGAGEDKQRPFAVRDGGTLLWIQGTEDGIGHNLHRRNHGDC